MFECIEKKNPNALELIRFEIIAMNSAINLWSLLIALEFQVYNTEWLWSVFFFSSLHNSEYVIT